MDVLDLLAAILLNKDKSYLYKLGRQGVFKITKERPMKVAANLLRGMD